MKKRITQNERYVLSFLLFWFLLQFSFFGFGEFEFSQWRFNYWWPFEDRNCRKAFCVYDISELIFYGIFPLLIFAIYYFVLKKPESIKND